MGTQESLSLPDGFESPHPAFSYPSRLARLLNPIILILLGAVDRLWYQLAMRDPIASQFICHDLPRFAAMRPDQAPEKALSSRPVALRLKIDINDFAILVNCTPEIMLLAIYLHEDLVDVEGVSVASVLSLQ
jgi:hypothetical protein